MAMALSSGTQGVPLGRPAQLLVLAPAPVWVMEQLPHPTPRDRLGPLGKHSPWSSFVSTSLAQPSSPDRPTYIHLTHLPIFLRCEPQPDCLLKGLAPLGRCRHMPRDPPSGHSMVCVVSLVG